MVEDSSEAMRGCNEQPVMRQRFTTENTKGADDAAAAELKAER